MHVQIDYEAWIPLGDVARNTGLHFREVLGIMGALWQSTQSREIWKIPKSKFPRYARTMDLDQERNDLLIDELILEHYLEEDGDDLIIAGNKKHIDAVKESKRKRTERAKKAANARWNNQESTENAPSINQASTEQVRSSDGHATVHSSTEQCSSLQYSSVHSSAEQNSSEQASLAAASDDDLDDSNFFDPDDLATPEKVIELWNKIIVPIVGDIKPFQLTPKSKTEISLLKTMMHYRQLSDWKMYFSHVATGDWYVNRRQTFSFHSVTYLENVKKEIGKYRQKSLEEIQRSAS